MATRMDAIFRAHEQCEVLQATVVKSVFGATTTTKARHVAAGCLIWDAHGKPDRVFQLQSGLVRIVASDVRGNEVLIRTVKPGEIFGEICLCSHSDEPNGTTALATSSARILETRYQQFRQQLRSDSRLMSSVLETFCTRLVDAEQRLQILAEHDARERLKKLLVHLSTSHGAGFKGGGTSASVTLTYAELANLAGLSRPHLSMLMAEFRNRGLVSYRRGSALRIHMNRILESPIQ